MPETARPGPARQLVLDLPVEPRFGDADFLVGRPNEAAAALLDGWPDWPDPLVLLLGPPRSGKSHLAAIWARRSGAAVIPAAALDETLLRAADPARPIVVEDLDRGAVDEAALFHLVNRLREGGGSALVTSGASLDALGLRTPDLLSRLRRAPAAVLAPPDDDLLRAVLAKLFGDRQLVVDEALVDYLVARIERSLDAAAAIVAAIDRESLSLGRRVTRPVASAVLARSAPPDEGEWPE